MNAISHLMSRTTLTSRIVSGLVLGVLIGLFFGERARSVQVVADIWIGLMQMTVLPYVIVSLISGLGQLDARLARLLAVRGGLLMLLFWGIAFVVITAMPMAFPQFESASFFSAHNPHSVDGFNPVELYIPSNPFHSMANTIIPAVVIFSAAVGIALIGMPEKKALIDAMTTFLEALGRVTRFVVELTPIGVFAIVAVAAGTMTWAEITRLEAYFVVYIVASLFLALWIIPVMIALLTPFRYRDVFRYSKEALITAFIAQNVFIILPMLIDASRKLYEDYGLANDDTDSLSEVIVPVTFNFPNTGKLLSLLFVPFAAWLAGSAMHLSQYPGFLALGLGSYFAKAQVALPFLLDTQKIPADLFQLYLPTGIINGKFDTMVSAMNLLAFSVIGTAMLTGNLQFRANKMIRFSVLSVILLVSSVVATRVFLTATIDTRYTKDEVILSMKLPEAGPRALELEEPPPPDDSGLPLLQRITQRGVIRVGYIDKRLPFSFHNKDGQLVGMDIDLLNRLALEMGLTLELVPLTWHDLPGWLNDGRIDLAGTVPLTTQMLMQLDLSDPYLDGQLSVVVPDHQRDEFSSRESVLKMDEITVAYPGPLEYIRPQVEASLTGVDIHWIEIQHYAEFFQQAEGEMDALIVMAEVGTAWSLLHPEFSVVFPEDSTLSVPLGFAVAHGEHDFAAILGRWLAAKRSTGELQEAYDYWILGKGAEDKPPRWSIGKDVLEWWDE